MSEHIPNSVPAKVRQPRKISPFWLLPIVAFMIGSLLFFQILKEQGQVITIRFNEGDGITAGKTTIRYQGLQIGQVKKVYFVNELKEVEIEAEITAEAKSVLKEGTKFWLVKPSASLAGVSGLDALVSGNYITLLPSDNEDAKSRYEFIAEEEPPTMNVTDGDLLVKLISSDLGSVTVGSSVYFRKVPVGSIADYRFTQDQKKVEIDVVIDKKYANLVKTDSHFWNISGINFNANLSGVNLTVDSLASMVQGAVAFDSPDNSATAEQGAKFQLYENLKSAQRGTVVNITLPIMPNLKVNETPVYYQNLQIGVLTRLDLNEPAILDENAENSHAVQTTGALLIDPNYADLLRSNTQILLKEPKFSLNKEQMSKIGELFRGIYFDIEKGSGEPKTDFVVQKETDYLLTRPNTLVIDLTAPQAYGVDQGQGIYYNDVQIGEILKRTLSLDGVTFQAIIFPPYRHLVSANSRFVAISQLDVSVGLDGLRVQAGAPADWLKGGVRILPKKAEGSVKKSYPLYKDVESAEAGIFNAEKQTTLTLSAQTLSGIDSGSVVLFRQFQVGEVLAVRPQKNQFEVDLFIEPKYHHLLSETSRFWIEPAVAVDISTSGVKVQTGSLMRTLKGAISFDNQGSKGDKTLYANYNKAISNNTYVTLIAKDGSKLSQGMAVKYMGLTVGAVENIELDSAKKQIKATAYIQGQYYDLLAKAGSKFKAVSLEVSTTGFKNIDALVQNYIQVEAGSGERKTQFSLAETDTVQTQYSNGLPIILETTNAAGITPEAPVLYRGMQVGVVERLSLSELGDRVLIHLRIAQSHKHLVRKNSEFWQASGYTMDISLSGASINSGTMSQLLNGGIAFATPSSKVVQPQAEANQRFRLQRKTPSEAQSWDLGIAE